MVCWSESVFPCFWLASILRECAWNGFIYGEGSGVVVFHKLHWSLIAPLSVAERHQPRHAQRGRSFSRVWKNVSGRKRSPAGHAQWRTDHWRVQFCFSQSTSWRVFLSISIFHLNYSKISKKKKRPPKKLLEIRLFVKKKWNFDGLSNFLGREHKVPDYFQLFPETFQEVLSSPQNWEVLRRRDTLLGPLIGD